MSGLPWFRMYTDFLDDPKMISLAFEDQRHFIGLCALKCGGVLDQGADEKILSRIVAQRLWVDYAIIDDVKQRLMDAGLIDSDWQPLGWDKRQKRSDHDASGAERQARHREKKAEEKRNALRNAPVTPPDKIRVDKNRKQDKRKIVVAALPDNFSKEKWCDYLESRRQKKHPMTAKSLEITISKIQNTIQAGYRIDDILDEMIAAGWRTVKPEFMEGKAQKVTTPEKQKAVEANQNMPPNYDEQAAFDAQMAKLGVSS